VSQDYGEAVRWFRLAAEQGHTGAQFRLGLAYGLGDGVPQDYGEAVRWFRLAAEQGHADAQATLGYMYAAGQGVVQDYVSAHMWLNIATAAGSAEARRARDSVAETMTREQIAEAQARARGWSK
jgi:TPR repeat protein